jgi:hypothetical protein
MRLLSRPVKWRNQRGSVSIEAAVTITFVLIPLLSFVLLFGRYFWYYTIAQKAAHDASVYLAAAPVADITSNNAREIARKIMDDGLADIDEATRSTGGFDVFCLFPTPYPGTVSPGFCSDGRPAAVKAYISMKVSDPFLSPITESVMGFEALPIKAGVTLPYVGR